MVKSVGAKSSTDRKAVSKSTTPATASLWKKTKQDARAPIPLPAPSLVGCQVSSSATAVARKKSLAKQGSAEDILFAAIPMGLREKYVPNPSNPNLKYYGRLMIPFYPMGKSKMNGNGLPMAYCLAHRGLRQAHDPVFSEEVEAGKKFIFFRLTWPGYYPRVNWNVKISLLGALGSELTRGELAWTVANQYRLFYEKCCTDASLESSDPTWRIGPGGFTFDDIRLAGLWTSGEDIWHASVMVLTPIDLDAWARAGMVLTLPKQMQCASPLSMAVDCSDSEFDDLQSLEMEWETPRVNQGDWGMMTTS